MINRNIIVERPGKTKVQVDKNGHPYVMYLTGEKRYNKSSRSYTEVRKNIGIMVDPNYKTSGDNRMYPNDKFGAYFPELLPQSTESSELSDTLKIGFDLIADKILDDSGIGNIIRSTYGKDSDLVLNLIKYIVSCETTVFQHYTSKMYNYPVHSGKLVSDSFISKFNNSEDNCAKARKVLYEWNKLRPKDNIVWFSYDASNINNQSKNISYTEKGHPKVDVGTPQINMAVAVDMNERLPLFPEIYSGSIPDIAQFTYMIDKALDYGYSNFGIICDRGYFSRRNVEYCDERNIEFMFMLKSNLDVVKNVVNKAVNEIQCDKTSHFIEEHDLYGVTIPGSAFSGDKKERYFHVFYDIQRNADETLKLSAEIAEQERHLKTMLSDGNTYTKSDLKSYEKRFDLSFDTTGKFTHFSKNAKAINSQLESAGYFAIITSVKMSASEALSVYRDRDVSEKLFETMKNELGFDAVYVSSDVSLHNKMFLVFMSTILRMYIYKKLTPLRKNNKKDFTVTAAVNYMQNMEITKNSQGVYSVSQPPTKKHKLILAQFGITESCIPTLISKINSRIGIGL